MAGHTLRSPHPPPLPRALAKQATIGLISRSQPLSDHFWKNNVDFEKDKEEVCLWSPLNNLFILFYGVRQVFVQYSAVETRGDRDDEFNKREKIVLRGPVVVTRNPCLHPGDVRQLEAVDVPGLCHLVDCVVFPRQGSRPHPNEMAGNMPVATL